MSTGRDPRVDPRPGDVLEVKRHRERSEVVRVAVAFVEWGCVDFAVDGTRRNSDLSLEGWRRWTTNVRVITRTEETP